MGKKSTEAAHESSVTWDTLEAFARASVQRWLQRLLEEEVTGLLGRGRHERQAAVDAAPGYRNGFGKLRRLSDKAVIRQLATCRWVHEHQNVLVVGPTGVGKSFLACALAHQACRQGYRAYYRRASRLFHDLTLARADGTYIRLLAKLARLDVLVLDTPRSRSAPTRQRLALLQMPPQRRARDALPAALPDRAPGQRP
jgi:hypothetical protein